MNKNKLQTATQLLKVLPLIFLLSNCKKEQTLTPESQGVQITKDVSGGTLLASTSAYDISNSLPSGYVKDGTKDYTSYLQDAINKNSSITFPAFPIMINDKGLTIGSNKTITFLSGSKLLLKPSANGNYNILNILSASNVTLNNPVVVGDRYAHTGSSGEWGQGIAIYGSSNITLNSPTVTNCWGDGIYVGAKDKKTNTNITITNAYCNYNRRNGISVTSVVGLDMESPYAGHSDGVSPFAGIDIEPTAPTDEMQKIVINNARTEYNVGTGISTGMKNLFGGSNKTISLTVSNQVDKGSADGFKATATLTRKVGNETVTGNIDVVNPYWRRETVTPVQTNLLVKTVKFTITNPMVQDLTGAQLTNDAMLALFTYKTNINRDANYVIHF